MKLLITVLVALAVQCFPVHPSHARELKCRTDCRTDSGGNVHCKTSCR